MPKTPKGGDDATQSDEGYDAETQPVVDEAVEPEPIQPEPEPESAAQPRPGEHIPSYSREQLLVSHRRFGMSAGTMHMVLKRLKGRKDAHFTREEIAQAVADYRAEI